MGTENDVRTASDQFYAALNRALNGDAGPMEAAWSRRPDVCVMHSTGGRQVGWDEVRASWERTAKICSNGRLTLRDQRMCIGDDFAYEFGTEHLEVRLAGQEVRTAFRVTNIYRREGNAWRMVHHHVDLDPAIVDLLSALGPGQQT